jgi:hypothetical protein
MALLDAVIGDRVLARCRPPARASRTHTAWIAEVPMVWFHVATGALLAGPVAAVIIWLTRSQIAVAAVAFPLVFELVNRSVHFVLSPREVVIRRGPFRLGRRRYPIEGITGVDIVPAVGFWAQLSRSRIVRRGPALRLRHRNGAVMLVSLPRAEEAAALLRSWRAAPPTTMTG